MKTQRSSCPSVSVATLTHLVLVLLVSRSIDLVTGCCYCGGTEDEGCLSNPDANVNGGLIDWVSEGICDTCSQFPDTKGYCCMGLPYCSGELRCPYRGPLKEIKEWMAKPIAQRREQKAPTTVSPSPSALRTEEVIISDHEGHACFIGDDELYHPAVDDSAKLENVMFCQDLMKDGITPVTVAPAKFVLHVHHAATEFTGVGVHISTGGKFCRLAYHARRELDGRYRIVCDVDVDLPNSDNRVEMFFTALADEQLEQFSIQDSTGSYCEMGWGVRCVFRTEVTSRGKFSFQTYDHEHEQDQNTSPTPSPNVSPVAVAVPSSSEPSSIDEVKVDYDPLPYTFGDRASYCVTSADAGIWDEPPYFGVGNDYTLRECLLQAEGKRYNFIHYWADSGLCRGLYECPFEYNCDEKGDCLDSDKGVRTFTLKAIPAIDEVTTSSPTEAPLSPLPSQIPTPTNEKPLCGCQYGDYIMLDQRWSHEFWTVRGDLGYTEYHQLGFDSFGEMLNWSSYHSVDFGWKEGSSYGQLFYHSFTTSPIASESSTKAPMAMSSEGTKGVSSNVNFDSESTMLLPLSSCWDFSSNDFDSRMAFVKTSVLESHPSFKGTSALSEWNKCQLVSSSSAVLCGKVVPSTCNTEWTNNYFGIELSTYHEKKELFTTGNRIVVGGVTYYVDAMQHHDNCNSNVGLVYVANEKECADGTPWNLTDECGFGGEISTPLNTGDDWCLYSQQQKLTEITPKTESSPSTKMPKTLKAPSSKAPSSKSPSSKSTKAPSPATKTLKSVTGGTTPSTTSGAVSAQTSPIAAVVAALVWCIL